jgi:sarcosine oxidase subunit beta
MPVDDSIEHSKNFLTKIFPFIAEVEIDRVWTGLMPYSPDEFPIIGKVATLPGEVYILGGLHGEGMSLGPGSGELLARLMTGNSEVKPLLECASPDRCCTLT